MLTSTHDKIHEYVQILFGALATEPFYISHQIICWMEKHWPIKTVGPAILLGQNDENHPINMFEPKHDACREWLGLRQTGSVVYVSLGSISSLDKQQMEELAFGLIMSNCYFLWVVRSSEVDKLPQDFTSLASEKGLMVEWCSQPQALAHRALACFVSHCGWNSTLEALSYGVPLIAMAHWIDQITNSKFIEDVWGFGIRVKAGENGIIGREEIAMCIKKVVHGEEGDELKANACKWKDLANKAVQKGGTSANNIEDIVSNLMCT